MKRMNCQEQVLTNLLYPTFLGQIMWTYKELEKLDQGVLREMKVKVIHKVILNIRKPLNGCEIA